MSKKRVLDLLTKEELARIQELKKHILRSSTNSEIRYYRREFDDIIQKAETRHFQKKEQTI